MSDPRYAPALLSSLNLPTQIPRQFLMDAVRRIQSALSWHSQNPIDALQFQLRQSPSPHEAASLILAILALHRSHHNIPPTLPDTPIFRQAANLLTFPDSYWSTEGIPDPNPAYRQLQPKPQFWAQLTKWRNENGQTFYRTRRTKPRVPVKQPSMSFGYIV